MKKTISLLSIGALLIIGISAPAYNITNINIGVDSNSVAWSKVNNNNNNFVAWLNSYGTNFSTLNTNYALFYNAFTNYVATNTPGGGGGGGGSVGITNIVFTNTYTLPPGSAAVVTQVFNNGFIAGFSLGVPKGDGNTNNYFTTNIVTSYNFTNQWLSSVQYQTYATNNVFWGASNYLARVNGYYKGVLAKGNDGGNPPASVPGALLGSLNGSNGWFVLTNGYHTTNFITVVETNAPGIVNPGAAVLYSVDHWELLDRTNSGFGQHYRFEDPFYPNDPATKAYADTLFANAFNNNWSSFTTSNGFYHFVYSYQNTVIADFASTTVWIPVNTGVMDGTGTNFLMTIYATNLTAGYQIQSSTNLALVAGFTTFTNYTVATNTGVATFTIPINFAEDMRFFRAIASSSSAAAFNVPLTLNAGVNSLATNTATMTTGGWTNLTGITMVVCGFTGTSVLQTNSPGYGWSRGTITAPIDIPLQSGAFLKGSSCAAAGIRGF